MLLGFFFFFWQKTLEEYNDVKMEIVKTLEAGQNLLDQAETTYEDSELAIQVNMNFYAF